MLSDLIAAHPVALPPGRIVQGDEGDGRDAYWLSDGPADIGLWRRLAATRSTTGLAPVLAAALHDDGEGLFRPWATGECFPDDATAPETHDPAATLAELWRGETGGEVWPGLAPGASFTTAQADAAEDRLAEELLAVRHPLRLMLAPGGTAASALVSAGWAGPANYSADFGPYASILADWEARFGARVVAAGFAELWVSLAVPPGDPVRVAAEHLAFCPDNIRQGPPGMDLPTYARRLEGATRWHFWWD